MVTHSSILAWGTQWTDEHGGLQSIELKRVRLGCNETNACTHHKIGQDVPHSVHGKFALF